MRSALKRFVRDESGATAVEYGLIVAVLVLAIIGGLTAYAESTQGKYDYINEHIEQAI